jgi:hypothetical protein
MPLPQDNQLDATINELYDSAPQQSMQSHAVGLVIGRSARLQAVSQRRLVRAIEAATAAQERTATAQEETNRRFERLERVGIWLTVVGIVLGAIQVVLAIWIQ